MARGSLLERTLGRDYVRGAAAVAVRTASERLQLPEEVETRQEELLAVWGKHAMLGLQVRGPAHEDAQYGVEPGL